MALAVFDLDGTLIDGQSQRMLLSYLSDRGEISWLSSVRIAAWFIGYNLGIVSDPVVIMQTAFSFLNGWTQSQTESLGLQFFQERLNSKIYPRAIELVEYHKSKGHKVIIVSNAVEFIVRPVAELLKCDDYFGTKLEFIESRYTGRPSGSFMYGPAKTHAVKIYSQHHSIKHSDIWAYGDHPSDSSLLSIVGHPVATNPTKEMKAIANIHGWKIIELKDKN